MSQIITPRWLTRKGARQYTGLALSTIDLRIRDKCFKTHMVGGRRLIDRESLDAWIGRPVFSGPEDWDSNESIKTTAPKGWFNVSNAAAYSDFSVSAIEKAIRSGQLPSRKVHITGNRISRRIKRDWVDS